jgi:hypothetical protein
MFELRRREFITLLGGAAVRAAADTQAQSSEPATNQRFEWAKHRRALEDRSLESR